MGSKPPEIFSSPRKPRKVRVKSQPAEVAAPDAEIESVSLSAEDTKPEEGMSDILFGKDEPSEEDLENMSKELMLESSENNMPDIFNDPETNGEGEN